MVPPSHPAHCPSLDHLQAYCLLLDIWVPYSCTILNSWYHNCFVSLFLHCLVFHFDVTFEDLLFAFAMVLLIGLFHDMSSEIVTPRFLADCTSSRTWPCKVYGNVTLDFFLVIRSTWHFAGWNSMSHSLSQSPSLLRSSCSLLQSSTALTDK